MQLGEVLGTVVATTRVPGLDGVRFLVVQPLDRELRPRGRAVIAGDGVHMAGPGELVYFVASREAALAMPETFVPVDHAVVGIVDQLAIDGELRSQGSWKGTPRSARAKRRPRTGGSKGAGGSSA